MPKPARVPTEAKALCTVLCDLWLDSAASSHFPRNHVSLANQVTLLVLAIQKTRPKSLLNKKASYDTHPSKVRIHDNLHRPCKTSCVVRGGCRALRLAVHAPPVVASRRRQTRAGRSVVHESPDFANRVASPASRNSAPHLHRELISVLQAGGFRSVSSAHDVLEHKFVWFIYA